MAVNTTRVTFANLSKYDLLQRQWAANLVAEKVGALGKVLNLKGRKDTTADLQTVEDAKVGDVWMIGAEGSDSFEEYYYTDAGKWEFMGVTRASLDGYVSEANLYKGNDGTGTPAAPADGTILATITATISTNADAIDELETKVEKNTTDIAAINNTETGILKQAKDYADTLVGDDSATAKAVKANTDAIAAINNAETGILAESKKYADTLVTDESALGKRVVALETELTDDDITNMFNANTASLTA